MKASCRCPFRLSEFLFPKTDHAGYDNKGSTTKPAKAIPMSFDAANESPLWKYKKQSSIATMKGGTVIIRTTCASLSIYLFLSEYSIMILHIWLVRHCQPFEAGE
jgi:hypothetical protein